MTVTHNVTKFPRVLFALTTLCLTLLGAANALNCSIDLGEVGSYNDAQCDNGCQSCSFHLVNSAYNYGNISCLSAVPCSIAVSNTWYNSALLGTTVDGRTALSLTIDSTGNKYSLWRMATIFAPENGGDFSFHASIPQAVYMTDFYAHDSGSVQFEFDDDGTETGTLFSMNVFAKTATALSVRLNTGATFAKARIECPVSGTCVWNSNGSYILDAYQYVDLITANGTEDVSLLCNNSRACVGVRVRCNREDDVCDMHYSDDDTEWRCDGRCDDHWSQPGLCDIDLSRMPALLSTVQCDSSCLSCNFSLKNTLARGTFLTCTSSVPCSLTADSYLMGAMNSMQINAQSANSLSVHISGAADEFLSGAKIYAPRYEGDFQFESTAQSLGYATFYVHESGVADIIFRDGSGGVLATNTQKLSFVIPNGATYGSLSIDCSFAAECVWSSNGSRFDENVIVDIYSYDFSKVDVVCNSSVACDGLRLHCSDQGSNDWCELIYNNSQWVCSGGCNAETTTTTMPTTTVPMSTSIPGTTAMKLPSTTGVTSMPGTTDTLHSTSATQTMRTTTPLPSVHWTSIPSTSNVETTTTAEAHTTLELYSTTEFTERPSASASHHTVGFWTFVATFWIFFQ